LGTGETVFVATIDKNDATYLAMQIVGMDYNASCTATWTFPDGVKIWSGAVYGVDIGAPLRLRSRHYPQGPFIPYDYIPAGNHVLRIKCSTYSNLRIGATYY
jgi:hypothetical protein